VRPGGGEYSNTMDFMYSKEMRYMVQSHDKTILGINHTKAGKADKNSLLRSKIMAGLARKTAGPKKITSRMLLSKSILFLEA
jgi:hypothetical protein